ncbi:hypothetical protein HKD37_18G051816 [Glycine soja]
MYRRKSLHFQSQVTIASTSNLKYLSAVKCESLSHVIPFYLLPFLGNLKDITVRNCQSVKAIFDVKDIGADYIWNLNNPDEIISLQDLQEVYIANCQSLKMANHLVKLVKHCERLEEIFVEDEAALKGETKQFTFHCLTSLILRELPELKHFYHMENTR